MKIGAVSYQTHQHFAGENKKSNKLRNTAGAAAIVIATAMPIEKADAQIYYPPVYPHYPTQIYTPTPQTSIPHCFVFGDTKYSGENKTLKDMFNEIDQNGEKDGVITSKEVVKTERNNWNRRSLTPFTPEQMVQTERLFNSLSRIYNEENSNPKTMNYREYMSVIEDFEKTAPMENLRNLINILTIPYLYDPPHRHHHYDRHHHHHRY